MVLRLSYWRFPRRPEAPRGCDVERASLGIALRGVNNPVRVRSDLASCVNGLVRSRAARKNISLSFLRKLRFNGLIPPRCRGTYASSRTWGGMRWTRSCRKTCGIGADGEIVWSWRPKGSASSWRRCSVHRGLRRWQSARFTEESAYKP